MQSAQDVHVVRAVDGDRAALEGLLRECEPMLRARLTVHPRWRRSLEADDVIQVTWLEAFLRIGALRERTRPGFEAWLARIAANNLRDSLRALQRDKRPEAHGRVTRGPAGESARTLLGRLAGEASSVGSRAAGREEVERLRDALQQLPESYRRVVEAVDLQERSVAEVASESGRSPGAVHMLRSRAHDRLREILEQAGAKSGESA